MYTSASLVKLALKLHQECQNNCKEIFLVSYAFLLCTGGANGYGSTFYYDGVIGGINVGIELGASNLQANPPGL